MSHLGYYDPSNDTSSATARASWTHGPVPPTDRVIANLRKSNESLRGALLEAQGDFRSKSHIAFWRGTVFGAVLAVGAFVGSAAWSQGFYSCEPPDRITIESDGSDRAIVTYYNSVNECSNNVDRVMEADNGIAVRVIIEVGSADTDYRERITLEPQNPMMMAFPPEGDLLDGEERRFVIQGGLS